MRYTNLRFTYLFTYLLTYRSQVYDYPGQLSLAIPLWEEN